MRSLKPPEKTTKIKSIDGEEKLGREIRIVSAQCSQSYILNFHFHN
jgi:hypothetical protein